MVGGGKGAVRKGHRQSIDLAGQGVRAGHVVSAEETVRSFRMHKAGGNLRFHGAATLRSSIANSRCASALVLSKSCAHAERTASVTRRVGWMGDELALRWGGGFGDASMGANSCWTPAHLLERQPVVQRPHLFILQTAGAHRLVLPWPDHAQPPESRAIFSL